MNPIKFRTKFINLYFIIFVYAVISRFIGYVSYNNGARDTVWNLTEWLTNYQAGFIRRGLRGEIIFLIYKHLGITPYQSILTIVVLSFCLLCIFFTRWFIKKKYPIFILPCVFFLGNPILNNFWFKPDAILCLLFVATIYVTVKKYPLYQFWINVLLICGTLIHETFVIMYVPILLLLLATKSNTSDNLNKKISATSFIKPCLILLPTFIVFIITILNNGNVEVANKIWNSWNNIPLGYDISILNTKEGMMPGVLSTLSQSLKEGISNYTFFFFRNQYAAFYENMYGPLMLAVTIFSVYYILSNINKFDAKILATKPQNTHNKTLISSVLILQLCVILILFILGYDYGRWIFFWVTSSFTVLLLVPEKTLQSAIPLQISTFSSKLNNFTDSVLGNSRANVYIISILISFPMIRWQFPRNMMECSSLYIVFSTIGNFFRSIYTLLP